MATGARKRKSAAERQRECHARKKVIQQKQQTQKTVQQCGLYKNMLEINKIAVKTNSKYHNISMKKKKNNGNIVHQKKNMK